MPSRRVVDPRFAQLMRELIDQRALSLRALAARTFYSKSYLGELASGVKAPTVAAARHLDDALGAQGELIAMVQAAPAAVDDGEIDAIELARRVDSSDVGEATLSRLETAVDDLACAYATTLPADLAPAVRRHLAYVGRLVDVRKTLAQQRRLLVVGGWLSLLSATVEIDLGRRSAAGAYLDTARQLAGHAEHPEITAWSLETAAWDALTVGDYPAAVALSEQAQALAPAGSSALIQATAQEGRAWARMGQSAQTRDALDRATRLASSLEMPQRPEHHYRYDPVKVINYTATTLAWVGDPAAEEYARQLLADMEASGEAHRRPRRAASARLDLGLALLAADKPDEAASVALAAVTSGRIVPSNWWRATEILAAVVRTGIPESATLVDAYHDHVPAVEE